MLAIIAKHDLELYHMDVKIAFLNGNLSEAIYMKESKGFIGDGQEHKGCQLKKLIYGLKQASR